MKKNFILFLIAVTGSSLVALSQIYPSRFSSGEYSLIIASDSNTHSVLVSDLFADRSGFLSPVIGTGTWADMGKDIKARSLLYFNMGIFLNDVKPSNIVRAELILVPLIPEAGAIHTNRVVVKRVIETWEDSSTTWRHQPEVSSIDASSFNLAPLKKSNYYRLNVTRLVKNMVRFGNYGFQISFPDSYDSALSFSRWFASPRHEEPSLRPLLIITLYDPDRSIYSAPVGQTYPLTFNEAINSMPRDFGNNQVLQYLPANPATPTPAPVIDPPSPPKKDQ